MVCIFPDSRQSFAAHGNHTFYFLILNFYFCNTFSGYKSRKKIL